MKCVRCGSEVNSNMNFCSKCGEKINFREEILQLKCKSCGGTMTVDNERKVISCPFCGSKELLPESDAVAMQRIRSQTYKEVEFEKIKYEAFKEQRKYEQEQKKEDEKRYNNFKNGAFSIILIAATLTCLLLVIVSFLTGRIISGFVAIIQTGLFASSWLMGMQFVKEKKQRLHILLSIIGFALSIVFIQTAAFKVINNRIFIPTITEDTVTDVEEGIYTYQIRNYVGRNLASIGGTQYDDYGNGHIKFVFITEDGMLIDAYNSEQRKEYVVSGQSIQPGTNITFVHSRDRRGNPEKYLIAYQSYEEIILYVNKIDEKKFEPTQIIELNPILDRHRYYIRDYVGRNAASINAYEDYGEGHLEVVFMDEDGTFIDVADKNVLKQYIVIGQDIEANTVLIFEFQKDKNGIESDSFIINQNYEEITLTVQKLEDSIVDQMPVIE